MRTSQKTSPAVENILQRVIWVLGCGMNGTVQSNPSGTRCGSMPPFLCLNGFFRVYVCWFTLEVDFSLLFLPPNKLKPLHVVHNVELVLL